MPHLLRPPFSGLNRRAADSRRFAPLAADAHVRRRARSTLRRVGHESNLTAPRRTVLRLGTALSALALLAACQRSPTGPASPIGPVDTSVTGRWAGTLARTPCVADWSSFILVLYQNDTRLTGEVITNDGVHFPAAGSLSADSGQVSVPLPLGNGECSFIAFYIDRVERDSTGRATAISGQVEGRCCGSIFETFRFPRSAA